jgi:hypothetical protein
VSAPSVSAAEALARLQAAFLALLPRIELHAQVSFRHVRCPGKRADALAETVAVAWKWFRRDVERGKDVTAFVSALATYAARHVRSGRRVWGKARSGDVLSPQCRQRRSFTVSPLPVASTLNGNAFDEALQDNTQSPVPEQAAFRLDFPAWLARRCERDRRLVEDLMAGERTLDAARKHGLTPGRVSQLRRALHDDWRAFCGDLPRGGR